MAKILMVAAMTFKGIEGRVKGGEVFEVGTKQRADELYRHGLADFKKDEQEGEQKGEQGSGEQTGGEQSETNTETDGQADGSDQTETAPPAGDDNTTDTSTAPEVPEFKTHAEIDAFAKANGYDIPTKEVAKMDERRAALKQAIADATA